MRTILRRHGVPLGDDLVVFLHSSGATPRQWTDLAHVFAAAGARVAMPRLVGHDGAPPWAADVAPSLAGEVDRLCAQLDPGHARVHLVGHSYGGAVAVKAALSGRLAVASLTVYEPSMFALLGDALDRYPEAESPRLVWESIARSLDLGRHEDAARRYVDYWGGHGAFSGLSIEKRLRLFDRMPAVRACFEALATDATIPADLARLDLECLVMGGARSPQPSQDLCGIVAGHVPGARLHRFARLDHMGPIADPRSVNAVVGEFLLPWFARAAKIA